MYTKRLNETINTTCENTDFFMKGRSIPLFIFITHNCNPLETPLT